MMRRQQLVRCVAIFAALVFGQAYAAPCDHLTFHLPEGDEAPAPRLRNLTRYYLESYGPVSPESETGSDPSSVTIACSQLPAASEAEFVATADRRGHELYLAIERLGNRDYLTTRGQRGEAAWLPPTLAEFAALTHFSEWPSRVVARSAVKQKTRALFTGSLDGQRVAVAQTHESECGDLTTPVRETEVAVARPDGSGNFDFYVYSRLGKLTDRSMFPAGERVAPLICAACHYDRSTGKVERFMDEAL